MVVDGHEDVLPAEVACTLGAVGGDAVPDLVEAAQLLDVDVQQLAQRRSCVTLHRLDRSDIAELGQPRAAQHSADGCLGDACVRCNTGLQEQLAAQLDDGQCHARFDGSRRTVRSRGLVQQARRPFGQVATEPLACSDRAHALLCSGI